MRITAVAISDFKRVRTVKISPAADRTLILIGGKNAQGKSSILDALTSALGGKRMSPADPVRHGAKEAEVIVELDGGELVIRRVFQPDGESFLEVRDPIGPVRGPQAMLDQLLGGGARFLDPLAFLALDAKKQRVELMRLIPEAARIDELDGKRQRGYDRRTEIGRDLTKAEGELARLEVIEVAKPIDVAQLAAARDTWAAEQRRGYELGVELAKADAIARRAVGDEGAALVAIQDLEHQLDVARAKAAELQVSRVAAVSVVDVLRADVAAAAEKWKASQAQRDTLDADFARADAHNRASFAAEASNKRRAEAAAAVASLQAERDRITSGLEAVDKRKAELLAAAKLPVEGLSVADDGIVLAGVPFAQSSRAEQLRVALALAMASSPGLNDVWIRDGAVLDDEHLAAIGELAAAAGKRVWIERVGERDPGVIVIQDGKVKS